jgi:hypothetical protein
MAANTKPIFTLIPDLSANAGTGMGTALIAAANDTNGTNANNQLVFTAGAVDGSYIRRLRFKALGTNVQTVARIFLNNGSDPTVAANNRWYEDFQLPATTLSANAPTGIGQDLVMEFALPPGWRIYAGLATAVAAGYVVTPIAGRYS